MNGLSQRLDRLMERVPPWARLTIRVRMTLTYAVLFLTGGLILIGVMSYSIYRSTFVALPQQPGEDTAAEEDMRVRLRHLALDRLVDHSLAGLAILVVLAAAAGWYVSGRALARLSKITDAARTASEATLHKRLEFPGPADELKELADTFDEMLGRLDAAFDAQKRFVANASHELRTPLTVTRTAVEVTLAKPNATVAQLRAMGEEVHVATGRAQRLIDGLLTLARSEQSLSLSEEDDLSDLAAEGLDLVSGDARKRGLVVEASLGAAPIRGDVPLLGRAIGNLLENAVRYNVDGGLLSVRTSSDGTRRRLEVANDGLVIEPGDVDRLFEPFHRGERTRLGSDGELPPGGTGLGLSIVRAVATAHGGSVTASARPYGGLRMVLDLPATPTA